ncbi:hypothetical protein SteCoe_23244 [Stentor coeruleus]|uniref:protein-L-isoaspartate(D-aspartate) O-methyltransferase n=1 Tax=Stentor coeruleus TaxID=5963 RepID=A0A1R2BKC2_9CILI|nr:hypothetical protein SteCoe_23244 [Stentor coeruleus]
MDLLTCPICMHEFNSDNYIPLILHCGHTFCKKCIENTERRMGALQCSLCRGLDFRDISVIKKNLIVFQNLNPSGKVPLVPCPIHSSNECTFFCSTENIPFCSKCVTTHKTHEFYDIDDQQITQGTDIKIDDKLTCVQEALKIANDERSKAITIMERFDGKKEQKLSELNKKFDEIIEQINIKRKNFVQCLNGKYNSTARKIQKVIESCEDIITKKKIDAKTLLNGKKEISFLASSARYKAFQQLETIDLSSTSLSKDINKLEEVIETADLEVPINSSSILESILNLKTPDMQLEEAFQFKPKDVSLIIHENNPHQVELVNQLIEEGIEISSKVKAILENTDRKFFMPQECRPYEDRPQRIGFNTTISAPHMHAYTLGWLEKFIKPGMTILDVGCGSGYLTVCLAKMLGKGRVFGIDHIEELINQAMENIYKSHPEFMDNSEIQIQMIHRDGRLGLAEYGPFNIIHIGASTPEVPSALIDQLAPGGILMAPIGPITSNQRITFIEKTLNGSLNSSSGLGVCYAPLTDREKQCPASY